MLFDGKRLYPGNINQYVGMTCPAPKLVPGVKSLLQNDYGESDDCTLTSITTVIKWMKPSLDVNEIYNKVEVTAKKYGYRGKGGTPSLVIKSLYQNIIKAFGLGKIVHSRYLKDIGFGWRYIKKEIDEYQPVLLNLWRDGRNFYQNHTILIVGYLEVDGDRLLAVYDNWYHGISYVDYDRLNMICSIDFLENQ